MRRMRPILRQLFAFRRVAAVAMMAFLAFFNTGNAEIDHGALGGSGSTNDVSPGVSCRWARTS